MGKIQKRRIVVDTNVLISALLFGGTPGRLVTLWKEGRVHPYASREILDEYLRILAYPKFQLSQAEIEFLLSQEILKWFEVVNVPEGKSWIPDDPSDDKFIWCALNADAEAIISGDDHLLKLNRASIPILTVAQFLANV